MHASTLNGKRVNQLLTVGAVTRVATPNHGLECQPLKSVKQRKRATETRSVADIPSMVLLATVPSIRGKKVKSFF